MKLIGVGFAVLLAIAASAVIFAYSGAFDVAADVPHSAPVNWVMEVVRDRSIAARTKDIQVPALDDTKLVAEGAEHYDSMCVGCHLAPGVKDSEIRMGLYPRPPNLTEHTHASPAEMFWVIKHGIKMTAMPAWGKTHDDQSIWGLVAFLQELPQLSPEQYQALVDVSGEAHHEHHHSDHDRRPEHGSGKHSHAHHY
jgi:mono/diheme cytochrome c family protein